MIYPIIPLASYTQQDIDGITAINLDLKRGLNTIRMINSGTPSACSLNLGLPSEIALKSFEFLVCYSGSVVPLAGSPLDYLLTKLNLSTQLLDTDGILQTIDNLIMPTISRPIELANYILEKFKYNIDMPITTNNSTSTAILQDLVFDFSVYPIDDIEIYYSIYCI